MVAQGAARKAIKVNPDLNGDGAPKIVSLVTAPDREEERAELFEIDGQSYSIATKPRVNTALRYMHIARTQGTEAGIDYMLGVLLGAEGYEALMAFDDLTEQNLEQIITIAGQILGGKNNINMTRTGHRYPNKAWATWRDDAVSQVRCQLPAGFKPFDQPVNMRLAYHAGDRRRRDMPAILDSIFHVLERAVVVADDTLIWVTSSSRDYDKARPRACIVLEGKFLKIGA